MQTHPENHRAQGNNGIKDTGLKMSSPMHFKKNRNELSFTHIKWGRRYRNSTVEMALNPEDLRFACGRGIGDLAFVSYQVEEGGLPLHESLNTGADRYGSKPRGELR